MKLYHYKLPGDFQNFGDDLNPWLWDKLLPTDFFDNDPSQCFVGIGTLINDGLPKKTKKANQRIIFSTGVGYGSGLPVIDETYKIYCLRGPMSAKALKVSEDLAITDGAYLIREVFKPSKTSKFRYSYMPHYELAGQGWENVCQELGFGYIDPRKPVETVLSQLTETEVLLTEAMHGAIIADAFRVPWIPIVTNDSILPFKWHDWCQSINVDYDAHHINRLHDVRLKHDLLNLLREAQGWFRQKAAAKRLCEIANGVKPFLSEDRTAKDLTDRLVEKLDCFRADFQSGKFD